MQTLKQFIENIPRSIPTAIAWSLADVNEMKGREELYTHQAPQRLKALREHAMIESAVSSNRIEGVEMEPARVPKSSVLAVDRTHIGAELGNTQ